MGGDGGGPRSDGGHSLASCQTPPASQGQECPPTPGGACPQSSPTSQRVVGVEPESKVSEAGEELCFHLPGGGVVHTLQAEGPAREGACVQGRTPAFFF